MPLRLGAILSLLMLLCVPAPPGPSRPVGKLPHFADASRRGDIRPGPTDPERVGAPTPRRDTAVAADALRRALLGNPAVPLSTVPPVMTEGDGDWAISLHPPVLAEPGSIARPAKGRAPRSRRPSFLDLPSTSPPGPRPRPDRVTARHGLGGTRSRPLSAGRRLHRNPATGQRRCARAILLPVTSLACPPTASSPLMEFCPPSPGPIGIESLFRKAVFSPRTGAAFL